MLEKQFSEEVVTTTNNIANGKEWPWPRGFFQFQTIIYLLEVTSTEFPDSYILNYKYNMNWNTVLKK